MDKTLRHVGGHPYLDVMTNPDLPEESDGLRRLRENARRIMAEHDARMGPIKAMIDAGVLADVQKSTAAASRIVAQANAAAIPAASPAVRAMMEEFNSRHDDLLARIATIVDVQEITAAFEGKGEFTAEVSIVEPGRVTAAKAPQRYTKEQKAAALLLLAQLHAYVMDLRRGDLADAGTLLLLIAALMLVVALQEDDTPER